MTSSITFTHTGNLVFNLSGCSFYELRHLAGLLRTQYDAFEEEETYRADLETLGFAFVPDYEYATVGALTSSPLIASYDWWLTDERDGKEAMQTKRDEMAKLRIWWYPNYMLENPFEVLLRKGRVEFLLAESV